MLEYHPSVEATRPIKTTPFLNAHLHVERHLARAGLTFPRMVPQKVGLKVHTWGGDAVSLRSFIGLIHLDAVLLLKQDTSNVARQIRQSKVGRRDMKAK